MKIIIGSIAVAICASVGYLIYFDQRRRTDPKFRQLLKKNREMYRLDQQKDAQRKSSETDQMKQEAMDQIKIMDQMPLPTTQEGKEQFFIDQLKVAEDFMAKGTVYMTSLTQGKIQLYSHLQFYEAAARCFFRVLQVYPDPMQLMMVFEQSLPQPVFAAIMDLMANEMKHHQEQPEMNPNIIDLIDE